MIMSVKMIFGQVCDKSVSNYVSYSPTCASGFVCYFDCCCCSSSIYWTGPFPGVKSAIEACTLGGGAV